MAGTKEPEPGRVLSDGTVVPRLASDALRQLLATSCLGLLVVPISYVGVRYHAVRDRLSEVTADPLGFGLGPAFLGLVVYCVLYVATTMLVLGRVGGGRLREWMLVVDPRRSRRQRTLVLLAGGGSLAYGVAVSLLAIGVVLVLLVRPDLGRPGPVVAGAVVTVAGSWCVVACVFAVRYAELWARGAGITFPDESGERQFADFLYLAVQVSTTFSSSDVQLSDPEARRAVTAHSILAFAFNTVIIALLVSVVVGS